MASAKPSADLDLTFTLDEALLRERRQVNARRLHTVQIPFIRAIGFVILCAIGGLQEWRMNGASALPSSLLLLRALNLAYAALSWLVLRLGSRPHRARSTSSLLFLHLDILVWLPNLHHLEQGHLFFAYFLLVRVADQVGFGFRRALYFSHVVRRRLPRLLVLGRRWSTGRRRSGRTGSRSPRRCTCSASTSRSPASVTERLRNRMRQAMRTARELVDEPRAEDSARSRRRRASSSRRAARPSRPTSPSRSSSATISHEIRTPMNGVLGTTELLLEHAAVGRRSVATPRPRTGRRPRCSR